MRTISIINLKGGCAKTLSSVNIAHILTKVHRKRVPIIENDKQGDASKISEIKFSGQWLREVGFDIGALVKVQCDDGKLVIMLDKARKEEMEAEKAFMETETRKLKMGFEAEIEDICAKFVAERETQYGA